MVTSISYMHTQYITHRLKLIRNWEEKERDIGHFHVIHTHTIHNLPAEVDNGLGGKGERHWSFPVIHAHTIHNSPPEVDNKLGGKGERH